MALDQAESNTVMKMFLLIVLLLNGLVMAVSTASDLPEADDRLGGLLDASLLGVSRAGIARMLDRPEVEFSQERCPDGDSKDIATIKLRGGMCVLSVAFQDGACNHVRLSLERKAANDEESEKAENEFRYWYKCASRRFGEAPRIECTNALLGEESDAGDGFVYLWRNNRRALELVKESYRGRITLILGQFSAYGEDGNDFSSELSDPGFVDKLHDAKSGKLPDAWPSGILSLDQPFQRVGRTGANTTEPSRDLPTIAVESVLSDINAQRKRQEDVKASYFSNWLLVMSCICGGAIAVALVLIIVWKSRK